MSSSIALSREESYYAELMNKKVSLVKIYSRLVIETLCRWCTSFACTQAKPYSACSFIIQALLLSYEQDSGAALAHSMSNSQVNDWLKAAPPHLIRLTRW